MTIQNISLAGTTFRTLKEPTPRWTEVPNVVWRKTASGGKERAIKFGESVKSISYTLWLKNEDSPTDIALFDSFLSGLSGLSTTFTLIDHKGDSCTTRVLNYNRRQDEEDELVEIEIMQVLT